MPRRLAAYAATAVLSAGLVAACAAPAFAATDTPVAGTAACTKLVATDGAVATDQKTVNKDQKALTAAQEALAANPTDATLQNDVTFAQDTLTHDKATLKFAVDQATGVLCTGTVTTPPVTTTTTPVTSPPVVPAAPVTQTQDQIDAATDALSCTSTNADLEAIDRAIAAREAAGQTVHEAQDQLDAKVAGLHCSTGAVTASAAAQTAKDCNCATTTTSTDVTTETQTPTTVVRTVTVNPTQDDGSVAKTSGTEVTDVPAGSASTGAA